MALKKPIKDSEWTKILRHHSLKWKQIKTESNLKLSVMGLSHSGFKACSEKILAG